MQNETEHPNVGQTWLAMMRRRWWALAVSLIVGAGVAFVAAKVATKQYSATASLLFQEDGLSQQLFGYSTASPVNPQTEDATDLELVTQSSVTVATAHALRLSPGSVLQMVSAAEAGATDVVNVTATADSPALSMQVANEYAHQFILYREQADQAQVTSAIAQLEGQVTRLKQAGGARSQLSNLAARLSQLQVLRSIQTGDVQLAQAAGLPTAPSSPRTSRDVGLGLVVGLLVGLILVAALERFDQRIRSAEEARLLAGLPVLGTIPHIRSSSRPTRTFDERLAAGAEMFRMLRIQLRYFSVDHQIKSVLMTSAQPGDGKSTVAWNLAKEAALLNPEAAIILVDADLRRPTIAGLAHVPGVPGLAELLSADLAVDDIIRSVDVQNVNDRPAASLHVIPAGALVPNPHEMMASNKLRALVSQLETRYDLIVIDAPPALFVSDAMSLMAEVDGVIVITRVGSTGRRSLTQLVDKLGQGPARLLGVVLNDVRSAGARYEGYYMNQPQDIVDPNTKR